MTKIATKLSVLMALFLTTTLLTAQAQAIFDIKLTYGLLGSNANLRDICASCSSFPTIVPTYGLGADAVIKLPLFPLGFGLRYESMNMTASSGGVDFNATNTRTALLLNYRLIDTLIYLGPVVTYGLSHTSKITANDNGVEKANFTSSSISSYSIGLEAGLKLLLFSIGAEAGYEDLRWKDAKDNTGNFSNRDINMSGTYGKIVLAFGI